MEGFDGPFEAVTYGQLLSPEGSSLAAASGAGYLLDPRVNDSFTAVNDLLKGKVKVYRTQTAAGSIPAARGADRTRLLHDGDVGADADRHCGSVLPKLCAAWPLPH